jgi:hypothetical protein
VDVHVDEAGGDEGAAARVSALDVDSADHAVLDGDAAGRDVIVEDEAAVDGLGHQALGAADASAAADAASRAMCSPWIAAPIAPAHVPSSAVTTVTGSSDVVCTLLQLLVDRGEHQVGGRRHPATEHDTVRGDHHDHAGDADPEVPADLGEPVDRLRIARPGPFDRLLGRRRAADRRDLVGPGERLETAAVAAVAPRTVRIDGLVAHLAAVPSWPW